MKKKEKELQYTWLTMTAKDYKFLQSTLEKQIEDGYALVITIVGKPTGGCGHPGSPPC